ncbi:hypothetical protein C483_17628 [Natrialba hulunbeirensis JCM 10989]|uniref:Uncharacterized protein n=1 Tax=Natrialba hulunbeirensis JCM 10989 TaxID=1227493 RepID=L9ZRG4_9EURY|nr:hypothetical protein C483_17628 [Natrialba hulunbeirensis JCM 10989]
MFTCRPLTTDVLEVTDRFVRLTIDGAEFPDGVPFSVSHSPIGHDERRSAVWLPSQFGTRIWFAALVDQDGTE